MCRETAKDKYICIYESIDICAYSSFTFTIETDSGFLAHGLPAQEDQKLQKFKVLHGFIGPGQQDVILFAITAVFTTVWQTFGCSFF